MAIQNSQQLEQLWPGLAALLGEKYEAYPKMWPMMYEREASTKAYEKSVMIKLLGLASRKAEGKGVTPDEGAGEAYIKVSAHEVWHMAFAITEEAMEDNQYKDVSKRYVKAAARSMAYTQELNALYPIEAGFAAYTTGDGVSFFNAAHPIGSFTNSNKPTVGGDPNETYLENMVIQMSSWVDARGLKIMVKPRNVMVPPSYAFTMERLLKTAQRVGTANNDINALKSMNSIPDGYFVNPLMSDSTMWVVFTNCPDSLKFYERRALRNKNEYDFNTGNHLWKCDQRYIYTVEDPLGAWASKVGV